MSKNKSKNSKKNQENASVSSTGANVRCKPGYMRCSYCSTPMIHKDDGELHCPKERWYTFQLHPKSHNGYYAYPASHDSAISYVCLILRRIRHIFE